MREDSAEALMQSRYKQKRLVQARLRKTVEQTVMRNGHGRKPLMSIPAWTWLEQPSVRNCELSKALLYNTTTNYGWLTTTVEIELSDWHIHNTIWAPLYAPLYGRTLC